MMLQPKMAGEAARQCWREAGWAHVSFKTRLFSIQIIYQFEIEVVEYPPPPIPQKIRHSSGHWGELPCACHWTLARWNGEQEKKYFLLARSNTFTKGVERHLLLPREGVDLRGQWEVAQEDGTCMKTRTRRGFNSFHGLDLVVSLPVWNKVHTPSLFS